ncbi:MAG: DUF790 family protein [Magnetococcus sp. YQC-5]
MLTRELLRYDRRGERLYPRLVDPTNVLLQNLVRDLALIYEAGIGQSREELTEEVVPLINSYRSPQIAKGVNKLLLDRCTFQENFDGQEALRWAIFTSAAKHLRAADMNDLVSYRLAVGRDLETDDPDQLAQRLHADLPVRQPLIAFEAVDPVPLIDRYNMALVQGPLIWADGLIIEMCEPDAARRRHFFRYLKWFQLMARITPIPHVANGFRLELDGPLSLFDVARKYGIKLAGFLPAVCALKQWKIMAQVRIGTEGAATLTLDDTSGLKSHFTQTSAYIPDEFSVFVAQFKEQVQEWKMQPNSPLLNVGGQEWAIPDFSFRHQTGCVVHLELFHRWHGGPLPKRLQNLDTLKKPVALAIGIDRALTKQPDLAPLLEASGWFRDHGFPFNQIPPVKRVVKCLESFLGGERAHAEE